MKNIIPHKNKDDVQNIFKIIDIEKPSIDFTSRVMTRVALEKLLPLKQSRTFQYKYYLLLTPFLLAIIFTIPIINNWLADYYLNLHFINFSQVSKLANTVLQYFHFTVSSIFINITITTTILIALMCGIDLLLDSIKNEKINEIIVKE